MNIGTPHDPSQTECQVGDKVRLRDGAYCGSRGIVSSVGVNMLQIALPDGELIEVTPDVLTNYSLAARRAWKSMPKRSGRPKLPAPRKKMVSLRLDIDVWQLLDRAVSLGLVANREQAVNGWLKEKLVELAQATDLLPEPRDEPEE